ncbi:hypothetical protein KAH27_03280 [bacterium]|nr:hypothetical protein [bacterium]
MTPKEIILNQINHKETTPVPFTFAIEEEAAESLNEYYGGTQWRKKIPPYIVNVWAVDTDPKEQIDKNHYRDVYGGEWRTGKAPFHLEKPAISESSLNNYTFPKLEKFVIQGLEEDSLKTCSENQDSFLIGNIGWGLFEKSWTLRGFENALMDSIAEPDFYGEMLDELVNLYLLFVEQTVKLPVDAIMFGDDWGDQRGVILGPDRWRKFIKPRWAKIYDAVHASGKLVVSHCCGSVAEIMPDIIEIGLDVLESVQPEAADMNPYELKKKWGDKITFWGALGSQSTIPFGTPEEIKTEVQKLYREMGKGGGYILAPAKPIQPGTPAENTVAIFEAFTNYQS